MKILAKANAETYICEVSHSEIEKFLDLYYRNMGTLKVGESVDLGKGYDFASDTKSALEKTKEFFKSHESTVKAIANGFLVSSREVKEEKP